LDIVTIGDKILTEDAKEGGCMLLVKMYLYLPLFSQIMAAIGTSGNRGRGVVENCILCHKSMGYHQNKPVDLRDEEYINGLGDVHLSCQKKAIARHQT
jgi:hypothetical protein